MTPITRQEMFLNAAAGNEQALPDPITREEMFLKAIADNAGSGGGSSGGGGVLVVHDVDGTLDKTWQEIADADFAVLKEVGANPDLGWDEGSAIFHVVKSAAVLTDGDGYNVNINFDEYYTDSANGYPAKVDNGGGME